MRAPAWIHAIVEKYLPDVASVTGQVKYLDAWLEPGAVLIPTSRMSATLEGWSAWKIPVTAKGKAGTPTLTTIGEPSIHEFMIWAKGQKASILRELLAAQQIRATTTIVQVLARRLVFEYERCWHSRRDQYNLTPARQLHIAAYDALLHAKGVGAHPDEDATALVIHARHAGSVRELKRKVNDMADRSEKEREETPKETRQRLKAQLEASERTSATRTEEEPPAKKSKVRRGSRNDEAAVVKAGKGGSSEENPEPESEREPEPSTSSTSEESDEMKKRSATTKRANPKTKERSSSKGEFTKSKEIPVGSMIKLGGRNPKFVGKVGEVLSHPTDTGLMVKLKDGLTRAIAPSSVLSIEKKGNGKSSLELMKGGKKK